MYFGEQLPKVKEKKTKKPSVTPEDYVEFLLKISKSDTQRNVSLVESKSKIELEGVKEVELEIVSSEGDIQEDQEDILARSENRIERFGPEESNKSECDLVSIERNSQTQKNSEKEQGVQRDNVSMSRGFVETFKRIFSKIKK